MARTALPEPWHRLPPLPPTPDEVRIDRQLRAVVWRVIAATILVGTGSLGIAAVHALAALLAK